MYIELSWSLCLQISTQALLSYLLWTAKRQNLEKQKHSDLCSKHPNLILSYPVWEKFKDGPLRKFKRLFNDLFNSMTSFEI